MASAEGLSRVDGRRQKDRTEQRYKAVTESAERNANRVLGLILEERRERGRRDAAALNLLKKRHIKHSEAPAPAVVTAPESEPLPPELQLIHRRTELHLIHRKSTKISDLSVLLERPRGLSLDQGEAAAKLEQGAQDFTEGHAMAIRTFCWHASEVKVSHKMLSSLTSADVELLASFERPPDIVKKVLMAVHDLLGIKNRTWMGMKYLLHADLPKNDEGNKPLHQQFQEDLLKSASHRTWRTPQEKASAYPVPSKKQHLARIIKQVLEYTGQGRDPKKKLKMLRKYVNDPEFTPENASVWSKAAFALCVWVRAVDLHYKEIKRKPARAQIERAIENGANYLQHPSNSQIPLWLPDIATKANKTMNSKSYHDLVKSKNMLVRRVFDHPPPQLRADFHEVFNSFFNCVFCLSILCSA